MLSLFLTFVINLFFLEHVHNIKARFGLCIFIQDFNIFINIKSSLKEGHILSEYIYFKKIKTEVILSKLFPIYF